MPDANLTERQRRWFATVREGLERDTGKTMAEWVAIALKCPETGRRARLKWFKDTHGLLQNRASQVIGEAFGPKMTWSEPEALIDSLWSDAASRAIFEAVNARATVLPGVIRTARKGYTAWSRQVQFAAVRPVRGGKAMLGIAAPPEINRRLAARNSESWSERLTSRMALESPAAVDDDVAIVLRAAWEKA
jgi:hypothetical protein